MSYYDEASLITLFTGAAGKGSGSNQGKIASIKPIQKLVDNATNLVINGDFAVDGPGSNGELGTAFGSYGWNTVATDEANDVQEGTTTIKNGILKLTNASGDVDCRAYITDGSSTRNVLTTNTSYLLTYTIVENSGCTDFRAYNGPGELQAAAHTVGTHRIVIKNTTNQLFLFDNRTEDSSISIDNVSLKELEQAPFDWNMDRSTNLGASRINKDGLVERGRTQLLYNTPWTGGLGSGVKAPDGWTAAGALNGTFSATNAQGQITFAATDAYVDDSNKGDRRYLVSPTISTLGVYAMSVYVDAVVGNVRIKDIMRTNSANNTTIVKTFEDNTVADGSDYVKAGK